MKQTIDMMKTKDNILREHMKKDNIFYVLYNKPDYENMLTYSIIDQYDEHRIEDAILSYVDNCDELGHLNIRLEFLLNNYDNKPSRLIVCYHAKFKEKCGINLYNEVFEYIVSEINKKAPNKLKEMLDRL